MTPPTRSRFALLSAFGVSLVLGSVAFPGCNSGSNWGGGSCDDPCGGGQMCDTVLGCVDCRGDGDCPATAPFCVMGHCEECADTGDCGTAQACYPRSHTCQPACETNADCTNGDEPLCNVDTGACYEECIDDSDCPNDHPFCTVFGDCGDCLNNSHCGVAEPFCNPASGHCEECIVDGHCADNQACNDHHCVLDGPCTEDAQCPDGEPYCHLPTGECVDCLVDQNCGGNDAFCSPSFQCVECLLDEHCDPLSNDPFCSPDFQCVECVIDEDCGIGGVCDPDFQCQ